MSTKEIAQDIDNIIQGAFNRKPSEVQDAFNSVMQSKMADAIDAHRQEMAKGMFGSETTGDTGNEDV